MDPSRQGSISFQHCARLFPLPFLPPVCPPPCRSQRNRYRLRVKNSIVLHTNRAIFALNRLYNSPLLKNSLLSCIILTLPNLPFRSFRPRRTNLPFPLTATSVRVRIHLLLSHACYLDCEITLLAS